jgi:hypothetical protein
MELGTVLSAVCYPSLQGLEPLTKQRVLRHSVLLSTKSKGEFDEGPPVRSRHSRVVARRLSSAMPMDDIPDGHYFMVVWAYEGPGNMPKDSHTFASFYDGDDLADNSLKVPTISWLPESGVVHPLRIERGRNFSLAQTLAIACRSGKQLRYWGPYEITPDLYHRALARIRLLQSGRVAFSALYFRPGTMNCVEAAGDITDTPFRPGLSWGFKATESVVRHLSPFVNPGGVTETAAKLPIWGGCRELNASLGR